MVLVLRRRISLFPWRR